MSTPQVFRENKKDANHLWLFLSVVFALVVVRTVTGDMGLAGKAIATLLFGSGAIGFSVAWFRHRNSPPDTIEVSPHAIVWTDGGDRYVKLTGGELRLGRGRQQAWWSLAAANGIAEYGSLSRGRERSGEGSILLVGFDPNAIANACVAAGWRFESRAA